MSNTTIRILDYCLRNDLATACVVALACGTSERYVRGLVRVGLILGIRESGRKTVYTIAPAGLEYLELVAMAKGVA